MKTKVTYISDDGKEFGTPEACQKYESSKKEYRYVDVYFSYNFKKNIYTDTARIKFEVIQKALNNTTEEDMLNSYLSSVLGYKVLYSTKYECYYSQYKFTIKKSVSADDKDKYADITKVFYNQYRKTDQQDLLDLIKQSINKGMNIY